MDMSNKIGTKIQRQDLCGTNWLWKVYSKVLKQHYMLQKQNTDTTRTINTTSTRQLIKPPHHEPYEPVTLTQQPTTNQQSTINMNQQSNMKIYLFS